MPVTYFYTKRCDEKLGTYEVIRARYAGHICDAEDRARTVATQNGTELAGGYFTVGKERKYPFDWKKNYTVLEIPKGTKPTKREHDIVDSIIAMESGEASEEEAIITMQRLIDSGEVWSLQGSYGRAAYSMIEAGVCMLGAAGHRDYWGNYVPSRNEVEKGSKGSREYVMERNPDSPVLV